MVFVEGEALLASEEGGSGALCAKEETLGLEEGCVGEEGIGWMGAMV